MNGSKWLTSQSYTTMQLKFLIFMLITLYCSFLTLFRLPQKSVGLNALSRPHIFTYTVHIYWIFTQNSTYRLTIILTNMAPHTYIAALGPAPNALTSSLSPPPFLSSSSLCESQVIAGVDHHHHNELRCGRNRERKGLK